MASTLPLSERATRHVDLPEPEFRARSAETRAVGPGRSLSVRLFVTCWMIFVLHFATDIVREHYLAFSLAEDYSFRADRYLGLHVDIFEKPGYGAHIGNNPGVSMLGAIPYWLCRPAIDRIVAAVNRRHAGQPVTAVYRDPRPRRVEFYRKVRERGLDIQFALASASMQALFMAPLSACAAVVLLHLFMRVGLTRRMSLLLAFVYALGTPIFFRTAFLNQNLLIAHLTLFGFLVVWRPSGFLAWSDARAAGVAGLLGGLSLLSDYSGGVVLAWLGLYAAWAAFSAARWRGAVRSSLWYAAGAIGPIALLLFYQWRSFGSPWFPGQAYMPAVEWVDIGYRGVWLPQAELFGMLLFDPRFGLFVTCPILALGIAGFARSLVNPTWLPRREAAFLFAFGTALLVFFSAVQYTRLQWVTGIRYVVPVIPALFLLTAVVVARLPPWWRYTLVIAAFAESWCLSMIRATSVLESLERVFLGGFQLPWMNVLARMSLQYFPFMEARNSPLPLFVFCSALLYCVWRYPEWARLD